MSEKWTPGPWFVEIGDGEGMDDKGVAYICHQDTCSPDTVICSFPDVIDDDVRANVYLMASAPDMYAALKGLYDVLYAATDGERIWTMEMQQSARYALAKARGEA